MFTVTPNRCKTCSICHYVNVMFANFHFLGDTIAPKRKMSKRVSRMVVRCFPQASNFLASFFGIAVYMCILLYMYKPSGKHSNGKSSNKNWHLKGTITELNAVISSTPCLITRVLGIIRRCDDTNSMANTGYKLTNIIKC